MQWCILRTAPSRTLLLAAALEGAGFRAWTPQETIIRARPRSKVKRQIALPMMPMIVFADYEQLPRLLALSRMAIPKCDVWSEELQCGVSHAIPSFSVFRHLDMYPRIADRSLDAVRLAEQRGLPRTAARILKPGEAVRYADAGFEGMVGTVQRIKGRYAIVEFPGCNYLANIPSNALLPVAA
jgi:hypothetical protein